MSDTEEARLTGHVTALAHLAEFSVVLPEWPSRLIAARLDALEMSPLRGRDWEEFTGRACEIVRTAYEALRGAYIAAVEREADDIEWINPQARVMHRNNEMREAIAKILAQELGASMGISRAAHAIVKAIVSGDIPHCRLIN